MAMIKLPATEPSYTAIQEALGFVGVTDYEILVRPDLFGYGDVKFWAKYQPLDAPVRDKITDVVRKQYAYGVIDNWNYNLNDTTRGPKQAFNKALEGIYSLWREKPTGEPLTSPYRCHDYFSEDGEEGYNNECVSPYMFETDYSDGKFWITAQLLGRDDLPEGNLTIADLQYLGGKDAIITNDESTCFGLLYKKGDDETVYVIGENGEYPAFMENGDIYTNTIELTADEKYMIVYILLNKQNGRFITLPVKPKRVRVSEPEKPEPVRTVTVAVNEPMWDSKRESISFTLIISNMTSTFHVIDSAVAKLRFVEKGFDEPMEEGEYEYVLWDITDISAKTTTETSRTQKIPEGYRTRRYQVMFKVIINGLEPLMAVEEIDDSSTIS